MKRFTSALLLMGTAVQAGIGTMTDGTSFSTGVWTGDRPVAGGSAETQIVLEKGGDWTVANDLGSDGWLSLGGLTWSSAGVLTLTGEGLAFAAGDARLASTGKIVAQVPLRLDGNLTLLPQQEVELHGDVSGDGVLTIDSETCTDVFLRGKRTGTGDTVIRRGRLHVYDAESLGTGKYWIDNPEYADFKRLYLHNIPVVPNAFALCNEGSVYGRQEMVQVWEYSGETKFTGPITYEGSKIYIGTGNQVTFDNVFTAANEHTFMVFEVVAGSDAYLTRVNDFSDRLTIGRNGRVHLTVPGITYRELWMFSDATLVCDAENVLCPQRAIGTTGGGRIDLNGHSQTAGGYYVWDARNGSPLRILNSDREKTPTLTMEQAENNYNAHITFEGPMNFIKSGAAKLMIATATSINGDLTVNAGKLKFSQNSGAGTQLAKTITVTDGVLDLGGCTWRCDRLVMTGGVLQNGVLVCGATEIGGAATCLAELAGDVTVAAAQPMRLPVQVMPQSDGGYELPEGTVVYYPFNGSAEEMLKDCCGRSDLVPLNGTPIFAANGRNGGCLYVDGGTWLTTQNYPANMPHGSAPYTVVCWVRVDAGCSGSGGWVSYGGNGIPGGGNSFRFNGGDGVWNYWNNVDVGMEARGIANGEWHQVVGTWDGSTRRLYYDGVLKNTDDRVPNIGTTDFLVGRTIYDAAMRGWIDDLLIMNRAMSDAEVLANYSAGGVVNHIVAPTPRVNVAAGEVVLDVRRTSVCYHFDTTDSLFIDAAGNANLRYEDVNRTEGASCDTSVTPGGPGGTLYVNGDTVLTSEGGFPVSMPTGMQPYTVCVWVRLAPDSSTAGGWFSYGQRDTGHGNSYHAYAQWGGFGTLENYWNGVDMRDNLPNGKRFDDGWHSLVCTYSGGMTGRRTHYLDGVEFVHYGEGDENMQPDIGNELFLVGTTMWSDRMKGWIDELAVYNYAFSPAEVMAYETTKVAPLVVSETSELDLEVGADAVVTLPKDATLKNLHGKGTVSGDAALAPRATLVADGGSVAVTGTLSVPADVTVNLPTPSPRNGVWPLFTPAELAGEENLAKWQIVGTPKGCGAKAAFEDGNVVVRVRAHGLVIYLH